MIKTAMEKVLIVGAGLTGALTATALRQNLPAATQIAVWDKSRGAGGRMSTSRSTQGASVDLGAQYITATPDYHHKHQVYYTEMLDNGILKPLSGAIEGERSHPPGTKHYVTPSGVSSIVKHYLRKSADTDVNFGTRVTNVDRTDSDTWRVKTESGQTDTFDAVILTLPVPQIIELQGSIRDIIDGQGDVKTKLQNVQYSSRFALGLFFAPGTKLNLPWSAKYFYEDPCIRFISVDNVKRGQDEAASSLCVHTSVPFGIKHLEDTPQNVQPIIMQHLRTLLPDLPEPTETKPHKWRFSQVHKAFEGQPGCIVLHQRPLLICAGDAFVHSNFDGCIESAEAVFQCISKNHLSGNL